MVKLTYREKIIVELRDGDKNGNRYSLAECARILRMTIGRVRWIESKARAKLTKETPHAGQ